MQKGAVCTGVVSTIDIYPTLMELCGIKIPPDIDGKSFVPLLKEPGSKDWDNVTYRYFKKGISLRTSDYRLTKYYRTAMPDIELYDHNADPYENTTIAEAHSEIVHRLLSLPEQGNTGLYNSKPVRE